MPELNQNSRSDEVQDILGIIPHWVVRWGITVILMAMLVLILGSYMFKYPETINVSANITTNNPPAGIVARTDGKIDSLFVSDHQKVDIDEILAIIENTASYRDVLDVRMMLDSFKRDFFSEDSVFSEGFLKNFSLGEIQPYYSDFIKKYLDFMDFISINYHVKKIRALKGQIEKYKLYLSTINNQKETLEEEFKLAQNQFLRNEKLYSKGVISEKEYEESKTLFLEKRFKLEGVRSQIANTQIELDKISQQILDLELALNKESKEILKNLGESIEILSNQFDFWEEKNVLKSPIAGKVSFTRIWSQNQHVEKGGIVFTVVPLNGYDIIGRLSVPIQQSGKLKEGQKVNLKFQSFPYMEYGIVEARIKKVSLVPEEDQVYAELYLPNGLLTNYGKNLPFTQQMQANAEIITDNERLINKVLFPVKALMNR
jgi:multidrug resistance efflux pump